MIRYSVEETIDRGPGEIWAYVADIERHTEWMNVDEARLLSGRPDQVGARATERMTVGGLRRSAELEVSVAEPGRRIAWRVLRGVPFGGTVSVELLPVEPGRTRVRYTAELELHGLWRLLAPFAAREVRASQTAELRRLTSILGGNPADMHERASAGGA